MKFSIIIPVYNVEKYIDRCLKSISKQSYKNYEVIIINDGTKDNSVEIIEKYTKKYDNFKLYNKKNGGLSDARNYGLKYVKGDYLLFIDSDDYINEDLLKELNLVLEEKEYDLIKFKLQLVDEDGNFIRYENGLNVSKEISLNEIFKEEFCEPAWTYCYNFKFWKNNKFRYLKNKIHEDFGLTPEIIMKAKNIFYLNYYGYNYVQRENSIMTTISEEKNLKKAYDMLEQYDRLINIEYENTNYINTYNSFLANAVISKAKILNGKNRKKYIKEIKERDVFKYLLTDTFKRKVKKILIKLNINLYLKYFS